MQFRHIITCLKNPKWNIGVDKSIYPKCPGQSDLGTVLHDLQSNDLWFYPILRSKGPKSDTCVPSYI